MALHFKNIVPCGIADEDKVVTSLSKELGEKVPIEEVKERVLFHLSDLFSFKPIPFNS